MKRFFLIMWFVYMAINGSIAGWKGVAVYILGAIFYAAFCLLEEEEEAEEEDEEHGSDKP